MKERSAKTGSKGMEAPGSESDRDERSEAIEHEPDASGSGVDAVQDGAVSHDEFVALHQELEELNDRHLRLAAEFNNYRRRNEQERQESWARAQADMLGRLLDVLDDLQRVSDLDLSNATVEIIMEGVDLVERKFGRVLDDAGVNVIDPVEEVFDPELMEAIMRVPVDAADLEDRVAQVFQKGYALKGVLVRPARVSVYTHG